MSELKVTLHCIVEPSYAPSLILTSFRPPSHSLFRRLSALPLALWDDVGWLTPPITTAIAFLLLGIEEIGVQVCF